MSILDAARRDALFCACVTAGPLSKSEATVAIREAIRTIGGSKACRCRVAQEFGDHPDTAVNRMVWARRTVAELYGKRVA